MDTLYIANIFGGMARVYMASTKESAETARRIHDLSPVATAAMGRSMTAAYFLGSMLKSASDHLTITVNGGGPIGRIVMAAWPNGHVKAYCDNPLVDLPIRQDGKLDVGGAVGKDGYITVVRDMGLKEPYVGRTPLTSGEIAEDFAYYFLKSEQCPCLLSLGVLVDQSGVLASGGLFIQPLPDCPQSVIADIEALPLSDISRQIAKHADIKSLLSVLFQDKDLAILEERPLAFQCDCNRRRIEKAVLALGKSELLDIIKEDKGCELTCHFCGSAYAFTTEDLTSLLAKSE